MSDSFVSLYEPESQLPGDDGPVPALPSREEVFRALDTFKQVELVVIGGGLSGLTLAREAALQGTDVLLVEPGYFAERCSSWSYLIARACAHDPIKVITNLRALQSVSTRVAPHLATTTTWRDEVGGGLLSRFAARFAFRSSRTLGGRGTELVIPDLDERLLIRETALAARQEGALVLSAAVVSFVERNVGDGGFRVGVKDILSENRVEITAPALYIDPTYEHLVASRIGTSIVKRPTPQRLGVRVVFSVTEGDPSKVVRGYLSMRLRDGSIGSLTHVAPSLVEVCVEDSSGEPERVSRRSREVCERCGYSVVEEVSRRSLGRVFDRRSRASERGGVSLSEEFFPWNVFALSKKILSQVPSCGGSRRHRRPLPGEWREGERERFITAARSAGVSESTIAIVANRWQGRSRYLPLVEGGLQELCPGVLQGEISLAARSDQVSLVDDLLFGSLALHKVPRWRELVAPVTEAASLLIPDLR